MKCSDKFVGMKYGIMEQWNGAMKWSNEMERWNGAMKWSNKMNYVVMELSDEIK